MTTQAKPRGSHKAQAALWAVSVLSILYGCGGSDSGADSGSPFSATQAQTRVVAPESTIVMPEPAPFPAPTLLSEAGEQFVSSPTGIPYPPIHTLLPGREGPIIEEGVIRPWLSASTPIRFNAWVQTNYDSDGDGKRDRIGVRVVQPAEVLQGLRTPIIMRPSPYYEDPAYLLKRQPFLGEADYIRMGFTVVYADSIGTNTSDGCPSMYDKIEGDAMADVVRWLTLDPRHPAFDEGGQPITAGWSTGHVAMEGVSYGGTLPTMAAITSVPGLEAIVPVAAISNGYDYHRYNGVIPYDVVTIGELFLNNVTKARTQVCQPYLDQINAASDETHGSYNAFWKARNIMADAGSIKAATLIAHGQLDNNVKTRHGVQLYQALHAHKTPVQLWFHLRGHNDPAWQKEWQKQILLWYTRYLFGVNNGVEKQPAYVHETPSGEIMIKESAWPATTSYVYYLRNDGKAGGILTVDPSEGSANQPASFANDEQVSYESAPFVNPVRVAGTIRIKLKARFLPGARNLRADLWVDGKEITYGWANPRFRNGLTQPEVVEPDTDYDFTLELMPRDFTVLPGSKMKLTLRGFNETTQARIDPSGTSVEFPVVRYSKVIQATRLE